MFFASREFPAAGIYHNPSGNRAMALRRMVIYFHLFHIIMFRHAFLAAALCLGLALPVFADPGPLAIWFTNATAVGDATAWYQSSLPLGNGKLAAVVYGGTTNEQIQFNEDTVWGGQPHDYENTSATPATLAMLQTNCFSFLPDATMWGLETNYLVGTPLYHAAYQTAGVIALNFPPAGGTSNYMRSLDLNTATVNVHYDCNGVTYNRDIFASAPSNRVVAIHFTASQPGSITFSCNFTTLQTATNYTVGNDLVMHASVTGWTNSSYGLPNSVKYDARLRLIATGGAVTVGSTNLAVTNANDVVLLLGVASNVKSYNDLTADYVTTCSNNVAAAGALGFTALRQAQQADYTNLFNRVVLDLGSNSRTNLDLASRRLQMRADGGDPQLVTLDFQLVRYLMISGSRPGSQPLNLQGKWNDLTNPNWRSEMTLNINEEMNYWGAEVCNLSECTLPLFDMMQDLAKTGATIATNTYHSIGWVVHHNTDLWRAAAPCNNQAGVWPTGAAWLCQHVWWHYLYTGDTNWLATNGYPLMKGAAQFFQGFLVTNKYPKSATWPSTYTNWLVACPSDTPEQQLSNTVSTVAGTTMDNELLRDLFSHVMAACQVLNTDAVFSATCSNLMAQLPPDQVGSLGQLQEWLQDYELESRHCSHLVGFFPGDEISTFYTPTIAAAARQSIYLRGDNGVPPWGTSWRINLRTRLMDGDGAWTNLLFEYSFNGKVATNLVFGDTANRQLDAAFGRLSGIATMFLQCPRGEIILLPALPTQLSTNGLVSGLCAAGGFELDNLTWTNNQFTGATIVSKLGNVCNLRSKWPLVVMQGNSVVNAPMVLPGLYQFSTAAGGSYTILPATVAEAENLSATTNGATQQTVTNAAFSNWRGAQFNAAAAGNSVVYTVTNVTAGAYHLYVAANANTNCGQFQLACGPAGGTLTNVGPVQDTYSPTNLVYLLPINLYTPTNLVLLWTNLLREYDCGNWAAPSNGSYNFRLTVAGKNAGSSGFVLTPDYFKFAPATVAPANNPPNAPSNLAPAAGAANQSTAPTLQASAFSDPDAGDTQSASEWLVRRVSDSAVAFDSGTDVVHTTSLTLPAGALSYGTSYSWQARYADNHGAWGGYSPATAFTTATPGLGLGTPAGGKLVFTWPTNTAGFALECATNLASTNWQAVTPPPAVSGANYVSTNFPTNGSMFYRLHKP